MFEFGLYGWSLLLGGVVVVVFEILFPSAGLLGLLAGSLLVGGGWFAARNGGATALTGYSVMTVLLVPTAIYFAFRVLPRTPMGRRMILRGPSFTARTATEEGLSELAGKAGVAATPLRPAGIATFEGRRVDVVTRGVHLATGSAVRVVKVEGNRVIVEAAGERPSA
jgi:membrane-bound serine protease (ClpP class)